MYEYFGIISRRVSQGYLSPLRLDHHRKPNQTEVRTYTWPALFATLVANSGASYSLVWDSKLYLLKYENTVKYTSVTM